MKKVTWVLLALFLTQFPVEAAVKTETVVYKVGANQFKGYLAWDDAIKGARPGVAIFPEWWGVNGYARKRAEQLAAMGFVALAADLYGEGKTTDDPKEAAALAGGVRSDAKEWAARAAGALKVLSDNPLVDGKKLAAIGYCMGGSTALHLAFSGADVAAVVSFHGALSVPDEGQTKAVRGKILICHGAADSFIPEDVAQKTRAALDKGKVDYQFIYYGGAKHSFTNPEADKRGLQGLAYQASADHRSWESMSNLFKEAFGPNLKPGN
jgi:dienelactone hydrolase